MKNQFMAMKVNPYIILGKKYRTSRNKWMSFSIFLLFLDFLLSLLLIIFDYISFKDDVKVQKKKYLIIEVSISAGICVILFILMLIKIYLIELICISLYIVAGASYWAYLLVKAIILAINPEQGQKERKADFFENEKEFSMIIFLVLIASITSKHNGSLRLPGSLVLSSTAIASVDAGNSFNKYSLENGLYK